uniref:G_PROTEIN_RECEP_F1_2 domain-containing protein n=1 Tax=Schistosoma mansoni TaxID=6183 RepID=A0A5K4F661_SCHMA
MIMNSFHNMTELNTPLDTLIDCIMVETKHSNASYIACIISKIYGTLIGYCFPIIGTFNIITNSIVIVIFLISLHHKNRYFIYLGILAISDMGINIFIGWLWLFPSYGLPYITSGSIYYFILTISSFYCRLFKSIQIIWCNLRGNMYIVLAFDRLLLLYKPLTYKVSSKYVIIVILIIIFIISITMSLPIIIYTDLLITQQLLTCWFTNYSVLLSFYKVLFSNSCLFQLTLVSLVDIFFLVKMIKWSHQRHYIKNTISPLKTKQISKIKTLLLLDIISFICSVPSSIVYMNLASLNKPNVEYIRVLTLVIHMSWALIFLQSSLNIILYYKRIDYFRQILLKFITGYHFHGRLSIIHKS